MIFEGLVTLDITENPSMSSIEKEHLDVQLGGKWSPDDCSPWQKVAIVVPYRDRYNHLKLLLKRLHSMLKKQKIFYQIFIIEQVSVVYCFISKFWLVLTSQVFKYIFNH